MIKTNKMKKQLKREELTSKQSALVITIAITLAFLGDAISEAIYHLIY
jgi:23S rRNA maturation mini-RNase III